MEQGLQNESAVAEASGPNRMQSALKLAGALLVLPALYLGISVARAPKAIVAAQAGPAVPTANQIGDLEAAAQTKPNTENRINLSLAYMNAGNPSRALPVLMSVVAEEKKNSVAWNDLCVANTLLKSYAVAIEECNTAIRLEPNFALARNNLKWAEDEQRKAVAGPPSPGAHTAAFYIDDGLKQENLGFHDQALESWHKALELDPNNAVAMNDIGIALMMKKQTDEAVVWFNKALAVAPDMQLAKNNLAWARSEQAKR